MNENLIEQTTLKIGSSEDEILKSLFVPNLNVINNDSLDYSIKQSLRGFLPKEMLDVYENFKDKSVEIANLTKIVIDCVTKIKNNTNRILEIRKENKRSYKDLDEYKKIVEENASLNNNITNIVKDINQYDYYKKQLKNLRTTIVSPSGKMDFKSVTKVDNIKKVITTITNIINKEITEISEVENKVGGLINSINSYSYELLERDRLFLKEKENIENTIKKVLNEVEIKIENKHTFTRTDLNYYRVILNLNNIYKITTNDELIYNYESQKQAILDMIEKLIKEEDETEKVVDLLEGIDLNQQNKIGEKENIEAKIEDIRNVVPVQYYNSKNDVNSVIRASKFVTAEISDITLFLKSMLRILVEKNNIANEEDKLNYIDNKVVSDKLKEKKKTNIEMYNLYKDVIANSLFIRINKLGVDLDIQFIKSKVFPALTSLDILDLNKDSISFYGITIKYEVKYVN